MIETKHEGDTNAGAIQGARESRSGECGDYNLPRAFSRPYHGSRCPVVKGNGDPMSRFNNERSSNKEKGGQSTPIFGKKVKQYKYKCLLL